MKQKISKLFVCFLIANFFLISNALAATNIVVSSPTAKVGEEVTVDISVNDNTGFVGYQMALYYDTSKLEYISSSNGEVVNGKLAVISNNEEKGNVKQVCVGMDINESGRIMSITFKVKENIIDSQIPLELKVTELKNDIGNEELKDVEYTVTNGNILIDGNITATSINNKVEIQKNNDGKLYLKINDDLSKNITYRSSDESKAIVDENGNVTLLAAGDVVIEILNNDEVIDSTTIHIPSEVEEYEQDKNKLDENNYIKKYLNFSNMKYIIILVIINVIIVSILTLILKKKKRGVNDEEK